MKAREPSTAGDSEPVHTGERINSTAHTKFEEKTSLQTRTGGYLPRASWSPGVLDPLLGDKLRPQHGPPAVAAVSSIRENLALTLCPGLSEQGLLWQVYLAPTTREINATSFYRMKNQTSQFFKATKMARSI